MTTLVSALRDTLRAEMHRDPSIVIIGEDVELAYVFGVTKGLCEEFGKQRVKDTPMSEAAIVGVGIGAAAVGLRPVVEIQFSDFSALAMDQLVNHAAKMRYMSGGQVKVPMVIRMPVGSYGNYGPQHCQSPQAWFCNTPGLVVVMPSGVADGAGLLRTALRGEDPVVFLEPKALYQVDEEVIDAELTVPFGESVVKRRGTDVTLVATGALVREGLVAAELASEDGVEAEVVDPRTLSPLDMSPILESVKRTGRLVVADEGSRTCGYGAEIAARVFESAFQYMKGAPRRVCVPDVPIPVAREQESAVVPRHPHILRAIREVIGIASGLP